MEICTVHVDQLEPTHFNCCITDRSHAIFCRFISLSTVDKGSQLEWGIRKTLDHDRGSFYQSKGFFYAT